MDKTIEIKLLEEGVKSEFDFKTLISFMKESEIEFHDKKLRGVYGLATYYAIYLDMDKLISRFTPMMISYVILHEIGHYKRIAKMGKDTMLKSISMEDFIEFSDHVIVEEIYADRYSTYVFFKLNKEIFPKGATQELDIDYNRKKYRELCRPLFGLVKNDENNYREMVERFFV